MMIKFNLYDYPQFVEKWKKSRGIDGDKFLQQCKYHSTNFDITEGCWLMDSEEFYIFDLLWRTNND